MRPLARCALFVRSGREGSEGPSPKTVQLTSSGKIGTHLGPMIKDYSYELPMSVPVPDLQLSNDDLIQTRHPNCS